MRYEIQTLFANGEWQNPDGETYPTIIAAYAELVDFLDGCNHAVRMGYLQDFNAEDWRVQECQYEECEGE
jgi:hypothetical protein